MAKDAEDNDPAWLDTGNDEAHENEVKPLLFGTGKLDLADQTESDEVADDDEDADPFGADDDATETNKSKSSKSSGKKPWYGSIFGGSDTPPSSERDSLWTIQTPATKEEKDEEADPEGWAKTPVTKKEKDEDAAPEDWADSVQGSAESVETDRVMDEATFHAETGRPVPPTRQCCLQMFFFVQMLGTNTNLVLLVSQALPLFVLDLSASDWAYITLKTYLCLFALIMLIVEIELQMIPLFKKASFLRNFVSRGFLYSFFSLVCLEEADYESAFKALKGREDTQELMGLFSVSWLALFNLAAAWSLMGLGILYFLMGILCLQRLRNRYVYDHRQKLKAHQKAVEKWEEEHA
jgi:hypothetical protein